MPTAKSLPNYPAFGLYPNYAGATETVLAFWSNYARAASSVALWWTDKWIQAPALYGAWAKSAAPSGSPPTSPAPWPSRIGWPC